MTSLNNAEKINFIKNYFHQYVDLEINDNVSTNETVNLVIPIDTLTTSDFVTDSQNDFEHFITYDENYDVDKILSKYDNTTYAGTKCFCVNVIDGDTIDVIIPEEKDGEIIKTKERVRLVGVNTPEENCNGYEVSKNFLEKVCYSPEYYKKYHTNFSFLEENLEEDEDELLEEMPLEEEELSFYNELSDEQKAFYDKLTKEEKTFYQELEPEKRTFYETLIKEERAFYQTLTEEERPFYENLEKDDRRFYTKHQVLYKMYEFYQTTPNKKAIYIKIDSKKRYDTNGRLLAVLIVNNKNINEVLLKEGLAEIQYIPPSEFYPFDWGTINTNIHRFQFQNSDISVLFPYMNSEFTNIVFTPKNDLDTIYKYEVYKGVIYLKLKPFSQYIRMHLLPKSYNCSNTVLLFKDEFLKEENIDKTDDYYHFDKESFINSYYITNNEIRNRLNPDISEEAYNLNDWEDTHCDFSYNISESTKSINNLQICSGYRYNTSTPFYSVHFTGVRDNTNIAVEDRCTLIDANYDRIESKSNNITQYSYDGETLYIPKNPRKIIESYTDNIDHVTVIGKKHHKILKYINDLLYSEEDVLGHNSNENKKRYAFVSEWIDISRG